MPTKNLHNCINYFQKKYDTSINWSKITFQSKFTVDFELIALTQEILRKAYRIAYNMYKMIK